MGFDLAKVETRSRIEEGVFFPILRMDNRQPIVDDKGAELMIKLSGADASRIRSAIEEREAARKADASAKGLQVIPPQSWQEQEDERIADLVMLTEGWTDNVELDGKPFPFSKENAAMLYRRFPEIAEQMTARATSRLSFFPTEPKGSSGSPK